ncbi:hypothetical protein [uncultured Lutibacter sp.]|uniref:hypothetical protein n=1 Tax=uncultured Lutibacter sp. TaxID=437739 RepID=UPI0026022E16|nr:hypothetical protein [uncultured Lutibacter sp.]
MIELEILKDVWIILGPIVAALLTYFIAIKGKQKDVDIVKEKKLNIVISNMLDVWNYLWFLKKMSSLKKADLPIPFKALNFVFFKSDMINDKCFEELTNSIVLLKEYDPIVYYDLSGIGERFDYIRKNFILPFINSKNESKINDKIQTTYLLDTIEDIEENLKEISKEINKRNSKKILKKLNSQDEQNIDDIKNEMLENYYDFMMDVVPDGTNKPSFEEFKKELENPDNKEIMNQQFDIILNNNIGLIMEQVAEDPNMSIDEMMKNLENKMPTANNG